MPDSVKIQRQQPADVDSAVRALGKIPHDNPNEQSWYLSKLPDDLNNVRILRKLDKAGYIERGYVGGRWASPRRESKRTASWEHFVERKDEPGFEARIRLTEDGKDRLGDLREGTGAGQTNREPGRPRKSKLDKFDLVVARIIKRGEADVYRPDWKALRNKYDDELPKGASVEALRCRVKRAKQSHATNKAVKK